jgi:hypothetical protein
MTQYAFDPAKLLQSYDSLERIDISEAGWLMLKLGISQRKADALAITTRATMTTVAADSMTAPWPTVLVVTEVAHRCGGPPVAEQHERHANMRGDNYCARCGTKLPERYEPDGPKD